MPARTPGPPRRLPGRFAGFRVFPQHEIQRIVLGGTDLDALAGIAPVTAGTIRVGLVATMARWKGHEVFLRAIAQLPDGLRSRVRAYVIGGAIYPTRGSQLSADELRASAPEARGRFDAVVERWVRERQLFTFLREELDSDGPIFVYAMRDEDDLVRWILSWGVSAEVLGPAALRARVRAEASKIARRHAPDIPLSTAVAQAGVEA